MSGTRNTATMEAATARTTRRWVCGPAWSRRDLTCGVGPSVMAERIIRASADSGPGTVPGGAGLISRISWSRFTSGLSMSGWTELDVGAVDGGRNHAEGLADSVLG